LARIILVFVVVCGGALCDAAAAAMVVPVRSRKRCAGAASACFGSAPARKAGRGFRVAEDEACSAGQVVTMAEGNGHRSSHGEEEEILSSRIFVIFILGRREKSSSRRDTNESNKLARFLDHS
jgi:hypothetical protein